MLKLLRMDAQDPRLETSAIQLHFKVTKLLRYILLKKKVQIVSGCRHIVEAALSKSVLTLQKTKH